MGYVDYNSYYTNGLQGANINMPNFSQQLAQIGNTGAFGFNNANNTSMANVTPTGSAVYSGNSGMYNNGSSAASATAGSNTNTGGGFSLGGMMQGLGGLQGISSLIGSIGGIYSGLQQLSMAKKQFKLQKEYAAKNYANTVKSYNTALKDRANSRAVMESQSDAERDGYIRDNSLA